MKNMNLSRACVFCLVFSMAFSSSQSALAMKGNEDNQRRQGYGLNAQVASFATMVMGVVLNNVLSVGTRILSHLAERHHDPRVHALLTQLSSTLGTRGAVNQVDFATPPRALVRSVARIDGGRTHALYLTPNSRGLRTHTSDRFIIDREGRVRDVPAADAQGAWQNVVYGIWDLRITGPIIDLGNSEVSDEEIDRLSRLILEESHITPEDLRRVHRYVGKTAEGKKRKTTIETRFQGHGRELNKKKERRIYKAITRGAENGERFNMQALFVNALPEQVGYIEYRLIQIYDGTGDLGLNSNSGSSKCPSESDESNDDEDKDAEPLCTKKHKQNPEDDDDDEGAGGGSGIQGSSEVISG